MNPAMGAQGDATEHRPAIGDGVAVVGPNDGEMAERGEAGVGRMAEPLEIEIGDRPRFRTQCKTWLRNSPRALVLRVLEERLR